MSSNNRKKERRRLKRQQKHREIRRAKSVSPYKLAASGELVACKLNSDWRERGQATLFVLRRSRDGRLAMANFLVDSWCAGLKDAWGMIDLMREEYDEAVERMNEQMYGTIRTCSIEEARAVVAGGIRFARQNGFRLAGHYDRWTAFVAPLDVEHADLAYFGVEDGKLRWVGPMEDLRIRLIGSTVEEFMARDDVEVIIDGHGSLFDVDGSDSRQLFDDVDDDVDDEGAETDREEFEAMLDRCVRPMFDWCKREGIDPPPAMIQAWSFMLAALINAAAMEDADPRELREMTRKFEQLTRTIENLSEDHKRELDAANELIHRYVKSLPEPDTFLQTVLDLDSGEDSYE